MDGVSYFVGTDPEDPRSRRVVTGAVAGAVAGTLLTLNPIGGIIGGVLGAGAGAVVNEVAEEVCCCREVSGVGPWPSRP